MSREITGGCKCGAVRYRGIAMEADPFRCYCRDCQHLTGTGHSEMFPLVRESLKVAGELREFQMTGGSGQPTWSTFCPNCGAPLTRRSARMSDRVYVHAGSLDDTFVYVPAKNLYTASAAPWDLPEEA